MLRVKLAELFVDDQDKARAFYTEKLGFEVRMDAAYGPDARWLTVVSPDDPAGVELLLTKADDAARDFQRHMHSKGSPATSLSTDDLQKSYDSLASRGVTFTMPPTAMGYGGTDAVFDDGCGNLINLHQDN
jgi:catechol 2,3-dioxygenase-like lactoylglutathione lyase family enzyme